MFNKAKVFWNEKLKTLIDLFLPPATNGGRQNEGESKAHKYSLSRRQKLPQVSKILFQAYLRREIWLKAQNFKCNVLKHNKWNLKKIRPSL